jgi:hypothetical protein
MKDLKSRDMKAAGEALPPSKSLTGRTPGADAPGSPSSGRLGLRARANGVFIISRTALEKEQDIMAFLFAFPWRKRISSLDRQCRNRTGKTSRTRATFRPCLEPLEDRALPSVLTVTNFRDSGLGSLRAEIALAQDGDTINFSPSLLGKTIILTSGEIAIDIGLTIHGLGASSLAISGNNAGRIFNIGPDSSGVTISGLTLMNGRSAEGGAILDDGSSLTLTSDRLISNQAVGLSGVGGGAFGGALAILGESTAGMTVNIAACRFVNNSALGGAGPAGVFRFAGAAEGGAIFLNAGASAGLVFCVHGTNFSVNSAVGGAGGAGKGIGGFALGGAVGIDAGFASVPNFVFSTDTFSGSSAFGGTGGSGVGLSPGVLGGAGNGGALFYSADFSAGTSLTINTSAFSANDAQGGTGGVGAAAMGQAGNGGVGGPANGGAVFADFQNSAGTSDTFTTDTFHLNAATGGAGGAGGVSAAAAGGGGGLGGGAQGGALMISITDFATGTQLSIAQSTISGNAASGGAGGAGGNGALAGGAGAVGGGAFGGGLGFAAPRFNLGFPDTWTLSSDTIVFNQANGGSGGAGGTGAFLGGNGGTGQVGVGGGIDDEFTGTLLILHYTIFLNSASSGQGGLGGAALTEIGMPGANGGAFASDAGGLHIVLGTACASIDTVITENLADTNPDVDGTLGTC